MNKKIEWHETGQFEQSTNILDNVVTDEFSRKKETPLEVHLSLDNSQGCRFLYGWILFSGQLIGAGAEEVQATVLEMLAKLKMPKEFK